MSCNIVLWCVFRGQCMVWRGVSRAGASARRRAAAPALPIVALAPAVSRSAPRSARMKPYDTCKYHANDITFANSMQISHTVCSRRAPAQSCRRRMRRPRVLRRALHRACCVACNARAIWPRHIYMPCVPRVPCRAAFMNTSHAPYTLRVRPPYECLIRLTPYMPLVLRAGCASPRRWAASCSGCVLRGVCLHGSCCSM